MKKLVLFFAAAMFAVSFAACGSTTKTEEAETTEPEIEVFEVTPDGEVEEVILEEETPEAE